MNTILTHWQSYNVVSYKIEYYIENHMKQEIGRKTKPNNLMIQHVAQMLAINIVTKLL
jgi:hypothetical protein